MKIIILLLGSLCILPFGCKHATEISSPAGEIWYSNSFESQGDTAGWTGYGSMSFQSDVPPHGGNQSVYLSGGCIIPHATLILEGFHQSTRLLLTCWGKTRLGGVISLSQVTDSGSFPQSGRTEIEIHDTVWTYYQSPDTITCQPEHRLKLEMNSGGIVAGGMLIDRIAIIKLP
jgi:hypothetical protein